MEIVKINKENIDEKLIQIYIEGYNYHHNGRPSTFKEKSYDELKGNLINELDESTLLALKDEEYKAMVSYHYNTKYIKVLWVDQLVVEEKSRNKGYAKILMNEIRKIAKKEDCERIELCCWDFNKNAMDMYNHLGFKVQRTILEEII